MRDTLILEAKRFTNSSALGKEIVALLELSDYKLEVHLAESDLEQISEEYENLRGLGRLTFKTEKSAPRQKFTGSQHYEIIDEAYKKFKDGRLVALDTRKGREWYREQVEAMAVRQNWICGLVEFGRCVASVPVMYRDLEPNCRATFEHGDKRGGGGFRRDDNPEKKGNMAVHYICNVALASERLKP